VAPGKSEKSPTDQLMPSQSLTGLPSSSPVSVSKVWLPLNVRGAPPFSTVTVSDPSPPAGSVTVKPMLSTPAEVAE